MPRNGGAQIDVAARQVRDRNGQVYALDDVAIAGGALYYSRPIDGNRLFDYHWRWVLPAHDLVVNRFRFLPDTSVRPDWYIETDLCTRDGDRWTISDGYLDVLVWDGQRYELEDAAELADALRDGDITLDEALRALRALDRLCAALRDNGGSGFELLRTLAPALASHAELITP